MISAIIECVFWASKPTGHQWFPPDSSCLSQHCHTHCSEFGFPIPMFTAVTTPFSVSFTRFFFYVILRCRFSQSCLWNPFSSHLLPQSITHAFSFHYHYIINPKPTSFAKTSLEHLIHITNYLISPTRYPKDGSN